MRSTKYVSLLAAASLALACGELDSGDLNADDPSAGLPASLVSSGTCGPAALVAVSTSNANLYRWVRQDPASGGFAAAAKVGVGWSGIRSIASDAASGALFAIDQSGNLRLYPFAGTAYTGGATIAQGWSDVDQLVAAGDGVLYTIQRDGTLRWHRWLNGAWADGSGAIIGTGWSGLTAFSGGKGIVYAIVKSTGELRWYRHLSPQDGASGWLGPKTIGSGWASLRMVVGLGSGLIYAVDGQNRLMFYQDRGYADGSRDWANNGQGQQIGSNWGGYDRLTANPNACPTETLDAAPAPPAPDPRVPQNVKAYGKGGRDVVLTWDAVLAAPVKQYRVYRDGTLLGAASPPPTDVFFKNSATYVDPDVVNGRSYQYRLQTVFADGSVSAQSAAVAATFSNAGVPVPQVVIDSAAASDIAPFLKLGKPILETWYPKIANILTQPDYLPASTITLKAFEPDATHACAGAGWVASPGSTIYICAPWARSNPHDVSIFVHESTHVLQAYATAVPTGITEGMASWAADLALNYSQPKPAPSALYNDGYAPSSYFFSWILRKRYASSTFMHDLNVPAHRGSFSFDLFKNLTSKTVGQLWSEMSGVLTSTEGPLVGEGGKCLDVTLGNTSDHNPLDFLTCYETGFQKATYHASGVGSASGNLLIMGKCATAEGNAVTISSCNGGSSQLWQPSSNWAQVTLTNAASHGCLQPDPNDTRSAPRLVTAACNGSARQLWNLRP
jgi:hypothetical protein